MAKEEAGEFQIIERTPYLQQKGAQEEWVEGEVIIQVMLNAGIVGNGDIPALTVIDQPGWVEKCIL